MATEQDAILSMMGKSREDAEYGVTFRKDVDPNKPVDLGSEAKKTAAFSKRADPMLNEYQTDYQKEGHSRNSSLNQYEKSESGNGQDRASSNSHERVLSSDSTHQFAANDTPTNGGYPG